MEMIVGSAHIRAAHGHLESVAVGGVNPAGGTGIARRADIAAVVVADKANRARVVGVGGHIHHVGDAHGKELADLGGQVQGHVLAVGLQIHADHAHRAGFGVHGVVRRIGGGRQGQRLTKEDAHYVGVVGDAVHTDKLGAGRDLAQEKRHQQAA